MDLEEYLQRLCQAEQIRRKVCSLRLPRAEDHQRGGNNSPSVDHVVCPAHRIDHAHMCPADSSQNTCKNNRSVLQNHRVIPVRSCDIRPFPHRTEHQPRSCFCQEPPSQHRKYISDIRQNILLKKCRPNHRNLAQNRNGEGKRLSKADAELRSSKKGGQALRKENQDKPGRHHVAFSGDGKERLDQPNQAACNRCAQNSQKQASAPGCYGKAYTCATKHASFYAQAGDAGSLANQIPKQRVNDGSSCADHANENRC